MCRQVQGAFWLELKAYDIELHGANGMPKPVQISVSTLAGEHASTQSSEWSSPFPIFNGLWTLNRKGLVFSKVLLLEQDMAPTWAAWLPEGALSPHSTRASTVLMRSGPQRLATRRCTLNSMNQLVLMQGGASNYLV